MLRPQLRGTTLPREILGMLHRVNEARATTAVKRRKRLVDVLAHNRASAVGLDPASTLT